MGFVMVDTLVMDSPKMIKAGAGAASLYIWGLCYLSRNECDEIPARAVQDQSVLAGKLVNSELWTRTNGGYKVIDWLGCYLKHEDNTQELRKTREYKLWRSAVLARDDFQCVKCGSTENLHAHHILAWALYPSRRLALDNGATLCEACHNKEHGRR